MFNESIVWGALLLGWRCCLQAVSVAEQVQRSGTAGLLRADCWRDTRAGCLREIADLILIVLCVSVEQGW